MKRILKDVSKDLAKLLMVLVVSVLAGGVLLSIVESFSSKGVRSNLQSASEILGAEGTYGQASAKLGGTLDNWTDAVMISQCLYDDSEEGAWKKAMLAYMPESSNTDPVHGLVEIADSVNSDSSININWASYARYWHGYKVILKPLLSVTGYGGFRKANFIGLIITVLLVCFGLYKRDESRLIIPYGLTVLLLNPVAIYKSLQFSMCFYAMQIGILLCLLLFNRIKDKKYIYLFLMIGVITNYVDLLTYPMVPFAIVLVIFLVLRNDNILESSLLENIIVIAKSSISWGIGYAGMWIGKWVLATTTTDANVLMDAAGNAAVRSDQSAFTFESVFQSNWNICYGNFIKWFVLVYIVLALGVKIYKNQMNIRDYIVGIVVALMPVVWLFVFRQHSGIHTFFVHKELVIIAMDIMAMCTPKLNEIKNFVSTNIGKKESIN